MEGLININWNVILKEFGLPALVLLIWWMSDRRYQATLAQYGKDMEAMRKMYENNVELVKTTQQLGGDLKELIVLNTQTLTGVCRAIEDNQYCPLHRIDKRARGPQQETT